MQVIGTLTRTAHNGTMVLTYFAGQEAQMDYDEHRFGVKVDRDHLAPAHATWSFTTERGVSVELGSRTHRPGSGVVYSPAPGR